MNDEANKYIENLILSIRLSYTTRELSDLNLRTHLLKAYEYGKTDGKIEEIEKNLSHGKLST